MKKDDSRVIYGDASAGLSTLSDYGHGRAVKRWARKVRVYLLCTLDYAKACAVIIAQIQKEGVFAGALIEADRLSDERCVS
jgi:hypothetical protein